MGGLECVITGLMDEFKSFFDKFHITREIFTGMVIMVSFLVALSCVTPVIRKFYYIKYFLALFHTITRHILHCKLLINFFL